ncbi:MAG: PKD domain-containing protein, partial [Cyclobacteriaceae bacterium]|nr:PKD domain-containing protein [Cyclobacteriaceae bacterium]
TGTGGVISDVNSATSVFTGTAGQVYTLRWTVSNGVCAPVFDEVTIQLDQSPSAAVAGADQQVCGTSTNLTATAPAIGTGVWSFSPANTGTGGNINNPSQNNSSFTGTAGQVYTLRWTVSNGVCAPVFDEVIIKLDEIPSVVSAGIDQNVCGGFTTLQATIPNVGVGQWSFTTNPDGLPLTVFGDRNSTTSTFSGTPGVSYVLRWTVTNGVCSPVFDEVTINLFEPLSVANAGTDQSICGNSTTLSATPPVFGTGSWSFSPLPGSNPNALPLSSFGDLNNASSTFTGTPGFTYRLRWILSNGVCPVNEDEVLISFPIIPNVSATNQTICSGFNTNIAISNPNAVVGTTFSWTVVSNPGGVLGTSSGSGNVINQLLTHNSSVQQVVTYRITPTGPSGCIGNFIDIQVLVDPIPFISNSSTSLTQTICSNEMLNFIPTSTPTSIINWTATFTSEISPASIITSGTGNITDTPVNTSNVNGTVTYALVPVVNGCTGSPRDYVVTVKPLPSVASVNTIVCSENNAIFNLIGSPQNISGTTFSWTASLASGTVTGFSDGSGNVINQNLISVSTGGFVNYTVTPNANGCNGPSQVFVARVNGKALIDAGTDFQVCEPTSFPITGILSGSSSSGSWQVEPGFGFGSIVGTGISATYNVAPQDIGGFVRLRVTSNDPDGAAGPCTVASDVIDIAINRAPQILAMPDFTVCEPTSINLTSTISASASIANWSIAAIGTGTISASSLTLNTVTASYFPTPSDITQTLVFRVVTNDPDNSGPCVPAEDFVNVTINRTAKVNAGADFRICEYDNIQLNGSFTDSPSAIWSGGASVAQYTNVNSPTSQYTLNASERSSNNLFIDFRLTAADPDGAGPCTTVFDEVRVQVADTLNFVQINNLKLIYTEIDAPELLAGVPPGGVFSGDGISGNTFFPGIANLGDNFVTYTYTDPITGCISAPIKKTIVNPVTVADFNFATTTSTDGSGVIQFCAGIGNVNIDATPPVSNGNPGTQIVTNLPIGVLQQRPDLSYYIDTDNPNLISGVFEVTYTYVNELNAASFRTKFIRIFAKPAVGILNENACVANAVNFENVSGFPEVGFVIPLPMGTTISDFEQADDNSIITDHFWDFGNSTFSTNASPSSVVYASPGDYTVTHEVTTDKGCSATATMVVKVGQIQNVDFNWSSICNGDITQFNTDKVDPGTSTVISYGWNIDGNIFAGPPSSTVVNPNVGGTNEAPSFVFNSPGEKDIILIVETNDGCIETFNKKIFILDYTTGINISSNPYFENFDQGVGTWFKTNDEFEFDVASLNANSFKFGNPVSDNLSVFLGSNSDVWYTNGYSDIENSVVIGPCVDLSNVPAPMISLDYWVDTDIRDGAVVQYSINGGLNWVTLGSDDLLQGIDWYNGRGLIGNPGGVGSGQNIGSYGWTGKSGNWVNGRYSLDEIPVSLRDKVVFRVAFGSNNSNPTGTRTEKGFAFDNVYIGSKTRTVLVEHFANLGNFASLIDGEELDLFFDNQVISKIKPDFFKVQYHLNSPGEDFINKNSPEVPAARKPYYSVDGPPWSIMNGLSGLYQVGQFRTTTVANLRGGNLQEAWMGIESLKSPKFEINTLLDQGSISDSDLGVRVEVTYKDSVQTNFSEPIVVHSYLIQSDVNINVSGAANVVRNVVNKPLLGVTGWTITQNWTFDVSQSNPATGENIIPLDKPFDQGDLLLVLTFVQNRDTKEVYQARIDTVDQSITQKIPPVIVGIEEEVVKTKLSEINIYPNPAFGSFNMLGEGTLPKACTWQIVSQQGVVVKSGDLPKTWNEPESVSTENLADGIYFVVFSTDKGPVVYKKLAIINSNKK